MKRIYPLPEAIDGHPWSIAQGSGSCDTVARELAVPLGDSDADRFVRAHELAHAAITPRVPAWKQCRKFGISMNGLQACEDMRVHHLLHKAHIGPLRGLEPCRAEAFVRANLNDQRSLAASLVSSWNTEDCVIIRKLMESLIAPEVHADNAKKVSLIQQRLLMGTGLDRWIGFRNCTVPASRLFDVLFPASGESPATYGNIPMHSFRKRGRGKWGRMTVVNLPKTQTRNVVALSHNRIFRSEGCRLVAPYRLPVDGRVFVQKKRAVGGTVLIDGSGSMSLTTQDLQKIITTAPAATIAIYSGNGREGNLTIIGSRGRVVDDAGLVAARASGKGNIIDGPSLEWLADHDGPRFWISDGLVTGVNDTPALDLAVEAQAICTANQIKRVEKADAVIDLLKAVTLGRRWHGLK